MVEWFTSFKRRPSTTSILRRLERHDFFTAFHGARPLDVNSYYENGITIADISELNQQARKFLISDQYPQITTAILERAIAGASSIHDKTLFLIIDEREASGHYMIYGSEHICGIAAAMHRETGLDCRQILKTFGKPTQFRVTLPRKMIPDDQLHKLADHINGFYWDERRRTDPPRIDWSWILAQSIPGKYIFDHVHPESIPDPLLHYYPYRYRDNFPCFI